MRVPLPAASTAAPYDGTRLVVRCAHRVDGLHHGRASMRVFVHFRKDITKAGTPVSSRCRGCVTCNGSLRRIQSITSDGHHVTREVS